MPEFKSDKMKKYSHDIGNLKQNRIMNFQIGLIVALLIAIFSINHTSVLYETKERPFDYFLNDDIDIQPPPPTRHKKKVPPPKEIKVEDIIDPIDEPEFIPEPEPEPQPLQKPTLQPTRDLPLTNKVVEAPPKKIEKKIEKEKPAPIVAPPAPPEKEDNEIVKFATEAPLFKRCEDSKNDADMKLCSETAIINFINKRVKYPSVARELGQEGMAVVRFVVEKDGSVSGFELLKDPGYGMGEEALKVVRKLPKWERPGRMHGRKVRVYFTLPINFKLSDG